MGARTTALTALIATRRQGAWSDGILKEYVQRDRLDRRDAALASQLVYGVMQNRLLLDFDLAQVVSSPLAKLQPVVLDILRLGAYQILFLDKIPVSAAVNEAVEQTKTYANKRAAGLVNGSLRTLARQKDTLAAPQDLATKYSHPQPLVDCLRASMDEETLETFLAADNDIPKTALQCNPLIAAPEQVASALDEAQIPYEPHPWLPGCFLVSGTGNLEALPLFQSGAVYVQDPAAKLAALASGAAPGMRVLDCCAAPGGKSATLAQYMENKGTLVSCDAAQNRLTLVGGALERLGVACGRVLHNDAAVYNEAFAGADAVLCDVPCSGLGVLAKKPDIRQKTLDGLDGLVRLQRAILETAARYVRPGGRLVYSTCTLNPDENAGIVRPFLKEHPEFRTRSVECVLPGTTKDDDFLTLYPFRTGTDGFFIASLERL